MGDDYLRLVEAFPLCVLRDEDEQADAAKVYGRLIGRGTKLSQGERTYADALAHFIHEFDQREFPMMPAKISPIDRLRYVLAETGKTPADLMKILNVSQPLVSQILGGKRSLTAAHVLRLSAKFRVSPAYFL